MAERHTPRRRLRAARDGARPREDGRRRVVVERVLPEIDGGRFPIKRTAGETVVVTAYAHADGHDVLDVRLQYRQAGEPDWIEVAMKARGNDEWEASFVAERVGRYEYTVVGWVDHFLSWRRELAIKANTGIDVTLELQEGAALVAAAAGRCGAGPAVSNRQRAASHHAPDDRAQLEEAAAMLASDADPEVRTDAALDDRLLALMSRHADRSQSTTYTRVLHVLVDRERARFGAWYEMFPRSWGPSPERSATFAEAAHHLRNIAALGFDVVYLAPIHPIGVSFRKGTNNALVAGPNDPGSPWAIGSAEGGHTAVEPGLGTLDDFDAFVSAAERLGLEVALDLAYQCSPDHPYVRRHPEWFSHRPDGSIKYAENPPKKYQDIYPFNFETSEWQSLWDELAGVVRFWIAHGVRIFRVDNPHTKPYPFWEWLIAGIRRDHPDVIFLAEAFTRPKIMGYLAKLGFSQSYSYFTWRNTKPELEEYFEELTATELAEYLRPNLFANTPDILHAYLQNGGPPAFRVRLVLAATLGASYGIYSGFELCEGRAVPGTEEYLHSEKYQLRHWDWDRPGNIKDLVARVNRIRRENRALQFDRGLRFHRTDNPEIIAYSKTADDGTLVLVIVNLDPHRMQHGYVEVAAIELGVPEDARFDIEDLLTETTYSWQGDRHYVRLDPAVPAHILRVVPQ